MINKDLTLLVYPKHNKTACLVLKNNVNLYRINHLFNYLKFVAELELLCARADKEERYEDCLFLCDKKKNQWFMVLSFAEMGATLRLWCNMVDHRRKPEFTWNGTVAAFRRAVSNLLKMLRY